VGANPSAGEDAARDEEPAQVEFGAGAMACGIARGSWGGADERVAIGGGQFGDDAFHLSQSRGVIGIRSTRRLSTFGRLSAQDVVMREEGGDRRVGTEAHPGETAPMGAISKPIT
jgi:hypothetical protein